MIQLDISENRKLAFKNTEYVYFDSYILDFGEFNKIGILINNARHNSFQGFLNIGDISISMRFRNVYYDSSFHFVWYI